MNRYANARAGVPETSLRLLRFTYAPPGWTFERFDDGPEGFAALVGALLDRGFVFPPGAGRWWREHTDGAASQVDAEAIQAARCAAQMERALAPPPVGPSKGARF